MYARPVNPQMMIKRNVFKFAALLQRVVYTRRALRYNQHLHSLFYLLFMLQQSLCSVRRCELSRYLLMMTQFLKVKLFEEFTDFFLLILLSLTQL